MTWIFFLIIVKINHKNAPKHTNTFNRMKMFETIILNKKKTNKQKYILYIFENKTRYSLRLELNSHMFDLHTRRSLTAIINLHLWDLKINRPVKIIAHLFIFKIKKAFFALRFFKELFFYYLFIKTNIY